MVGWLETGAALQPGHLGGFNWGGPSARENPSVKPAKARPAPVRPPRAALHLKTYQTGYAAARNSVAFTSS